MCCGVIPIAIVENCVDSNSPNSITSIEAVKENNLINCDNIHKVVTDKENVIIEQESLTTSLKETVNTDKELFIYKDDIISKQTDVISFLKNSLDCGDLENVEDNDNIHNTFNSSESSFESERMNLLKDIELNDDAKEIHSKVVAE